MRFKVNFAITQRELESFPVSGLEGAIEVIGGHAAKDLGHKICEAIKWQVVEDRRIDVIKHLQQEVSVFQTEKWEQFIIGLGQACGESGNPVLIEEVKRLIKELNEE